MNSLALARDYGHKRVAIPFIGGQIFLRDIGVTAEELAASIVKTAIEHKGHLELRFVTFSAEDTKIFQAAVAKFNLDPNLVSVAQGSITDFKVHGASAIVNAANMQVQFGGGLSGAIASATRDSHKIEDEAAAAIEKFYSEQH